MNFLSTKMLICALFSICLVACASGSAIVVGTKRAPLNPAAVSLYLEAPSSNYEVVAIVSASSDAGWTDQGSLDYAVQELKNQAARLGANGVLLEATGESTSTVIGGYGAGNFYSIPVTTKSVTGKAVFVHDLDGREIPQDDIVDGGDARNTYY